MAAAAKPALMDMPFGRYRGRSVTELDDDYLDWLLTRCDNIPDDLRVALEAEEARRNGARGDGIPRKPAQHQDSIVGYPNKHMLAEIISMGMLQKLTLIHTRAEADQVTAAVEYMRKTLGI